MDVERESGQRMPLDEQVSTCNPEGKGLSFPDGAGLSFSDLASAIRAAQVARGLGDTNYRLSLATGIGQDSLSRLFRGQTDTSLLTVRRLLRAFPELSIWILMYLMELLPLVQDQEESVAAPEDPARSPTPATSMR